ncbi:hypothetical protein [Kingella negevensis]|nr:hypothetical protein [Kingella negevensis]
MFFPLINIKISFTQPENCFQAALEFVLFAIDKKIPALSGFGLLL